jgi:transcriptional regulator with XRE-family HTH domain
LLQRAKLRLFKSISKLSVADYGKSVDSISRRQSLENCLGVRQNSLSNYEKGQTAPTLDLLLRLKAHSGRSIDWIITGDE